MYVKMLVKMKKKSKGEIKDDSNSKSWFPCYVEESSSGYGAFSCTSVSLSLKIPRVVAEARSEPREFQRGIANGKKLNLE